jgi:hypothetical protein
MSIDARWEPGRSFDNLMTFVGLAFFVLIPLSLITYGYHIWHQQNLEREWALNGKPDSRTAEEKARDRALSAKRSAEWKATIEAEAAKDERAEKIKSAADALCIVVGGARVKSSRGEDVSGWEVRRLKTPYPTIEEIQALFGKADDVSRLEGIGSGSTGCMVRPGKDLTTLLARASLEAGLPSYSNSGKH